MVCEWLWQTALKGRERGISRVNAALWQTALKGRERGISRVNAALWQTALKGRERGISRVNAVADSIKRTREGDFKG